MNYRALIASMIFAVSPVMADETATLERLELTGDHILVTADGTGVIKNVICGICKSRTMKITGDTVTYVNNIETNIVAAKRENMNRVASITLNVDTNEVVTIRW